MNRSQCLLCTQLLLCIVIGAARVYGTEPQAGRLSTSDSWEVVEMKQINRFVALLIVLVILLMISH